jgi:hypothetical protein
MDAPNQDGLAIAVTRKYAIDYDVPPNEGICDRIRFAACFTGSTMFFTRIYVTSRDKSHSELVDLKFYVGNRKPAQTAGYPREWTLWITGETLDHGWMSFEISLRDAVKQTFGTQGFIYDRLKAIRVRGSLSISPLELVRENGPTTVSWPNSHRLRSAIPLLVALALCLILIIGIRNVNDWGKSKKEQQKTGEVSTAAQTTNKRDGNEEGPTDASGTAKQMLKDEPRTALEHDTQTKKTLRARDQAESRLREFVRDNSEPQHSGTAGATASGTATLTVRGPELDLREQAFIVSAGILNFILERERSAPPYPSPDLSPADWSRAEAQIRAYNAETMRQFNQAWGTQVINLHDRIAAKGLQDPALDDLYQRPTSPLGIRIIGEKIGDLAEKLPSELPAK